MCRRDHPFYSIQNPTFVISDWLSSPYLQFSCLLYLFLLVLRLLAETGALEDGCHAPHDRGSGGGVSVTKTQSLEGCSRAVNVVSSNRVIPPLSSKDRAQTLAGSHQLVIRARFIGERLSILCCFNFPVLQKSQKIVVQFTCNPINFLSLY